MKITRRVLTGLFGFHKESYKVHEPGGAMHVVRYYKAARGGLLVVEARSWARVPRRTDAKWAVYEHGRLLGSELTLDSATELVNRGQEAHTGS